MHSVLSGMPDWLEPMAATLTQERFAGPDWLFERKFDGIRLLAYKRGADVQLFSRNRLPQNLPAIAAAIRSLPVDDVILDGEMTWDGRSGYHVFDILWLDGRARHRVAARRATRAAANSCRFEDPMRRVELVDDHEPWERARREGWEGVIAKRRGSPYEHRRSKHWLKMKCELSQEFVVGGFTDPQGRARRPRRAARRLLRRRRFRLRREDRHRLRHHAPPGSANAPRRDRDSTESPFTKAKGLPRHGHWVRPDIVVQIGFIEWTVHGKLRHPRLLGVRADKNPLDVTREQP